MQDATTTTTSVKIDALKPSVVLSFHVFLFKIHHRFRVERRLFGALDLKQKSMKMSFWRRRFLYYVKQRHFTLYFQYDGNDIVFRTFQLVY